MAGENLEELRELVEFLKENGIAEFDMERADLKVRLKFASAAPQTVVVAHGGGENIPSLLAAAPVTAAAPVETSAAVAPAQAAPASEADASAGAHIVKSPIVGTFYDAPAPDADPFVKVGDHVASGQVLCIVEAMKLMNEIESDVSGEIVKVFVKPGQPVEYGQSLFAIKQ
jgi:acetyl-CoA carboxylase biotin carboxyl carrier protein